MHNFSLKMVSFIQLNDFLLRKSIVVKPYKLFGSLKIIIKKIQTVVEIFTCHQKDDSKKNTYN